MTHTEKRLYLINELLSEQPRYVHMEIPRDAQGQKDLLRSLFNVRPASLASDDFMRIQDEYLKEATFEKGITDFSDLSPISDDLYLWQGDITTLRCDAIVNAANSGLTGCYRPLHNCIDNCIHTYAGIQLRYECDRLMREQGHEELTGMAKVTSAYNLPCKYVIHTVGPIVNGRLTGEHESLLRSCYSECMKAADEKDCKSIAFCCISTGVFGYPQEAAAKIAIQTVREYLKQTGSECKVIFNVFKDEDLAIYRDNFK